MGTVCKTNPKHTWQVLFIVWLYSKLTSLDFASVTRYVYVCMHENGILCTCFYSKFPPFRGKQTQSSIVGAVGVQFLSPTLLGFISTTCQSQDHFPALLAAIYAPVCADMYAYLLSSVCMRKVDVNVLESMFVSAFEFGICTCMHVCLFVYTNGCKQSILHHSLTPICKLSLNIASLCSPLSWCYLCTVTWAAFYR